MDIEEKNNDCTFIMISAVTNYPGLAAGRLPAAWVGDADA
jgi:hypothetical protein